jgi:uncharacterized DUF497 family protein
MSDLLFEWDPDKDKENQEKHEVTFDEAKTVFFDDFARLIDDPEHSEEEDRFILMGMSIRLNVLLVCHCYREEDSVIRIISARRAYPSERAQYALYLP